MKAKTLASLLLVLGLCTLNFTITSYGHGGEDEEEFNEHESEGCDDGDIEENESLEAKVKLVATADAPEGAKGCAKLEAENEDGVQTTELELKTIGLAEGDYIVSAVRKSDGSTVTLGLITLACSNDGDDEDEDDDDEISEDRSHHDGGISDDDDDEDEDHDGDNDDDQGEDDDGDDDGEHHGDCSCNGGMIRSESDVELPADLDPMDIAQIIVSDTSEIALLVGDFVNPVSGTTIKFKACVELGPEEGAPECQGTAQILSTAKKGKKKNRFTMVASNVPASSSFDVQVNGANVGTVKSNKKGKALVKKLPANLLRVRSVQLTDSEGHAVARAKF